MSAKLLGLDIETAPALVWTWGLHDQNIGIEQVVKPSRVLCWAAKWFGEKGVIYADERKGAKRMLVQMRDLLSEADAVVTFNGDSFDLQKLQGEFVFHRISPPPPVASIDLYKTVRQLGYISGKLAFIGKHLNIGEKVKHEGFALWAACLKGDKKAWDRMRAYNIQDTAMLESLYTELRPYIKNHPTLREPKPTREAVSCPVCSSERTISRGIRRTKASVIQRLQCMSCATWFDGQRKAA